MILPIHILCVLITLSIVLIADHYGFLWIQGKVLILDKNKLYKLHIYTLCGLLTLITTGGIMFAGNPVTLLSSRAFLIKMAFIATLLVNAIFIGFFMKIATKSKFKDLSLKEKLPLFISGGISTMSWVGVLVSAFFIY